MENKFAKFKCNKCGKIVMRSLGYKVWTNSYCKATGMNARLYRISEPIYESNCEVDVTHEKGKQKS
jgi:ribosomal protein L37AE/L43A